MKNISLPLDFIKSTLIVIAISAIGALGAYVIKYNFIATFLLLFVLQYILFSFIGNIITSFFIEKTKQKELDKLEPLSTILECAYCNSKNLMTFFPDENERIEFECASCKNKNLVNIQFIVARITEPVILDSTTNIPLLSNENN
jgi:predicted neutral ceramidase superfamily lipid hydrolase